MKTANLTNGQQVTLVHRDQLRRTRNGRTLRLPSHLPGVKIPSSPTSFDGSKGRVVKYPMLGNDTVGDCYLADALHCSQTWTYWSTGTQDQFNVAAVIARYKALSGGDNGLSDAEIFPAWKSGLLEVNGPHRILDDLAVTPTDIAAVHLGLSQFCGGSWTASLPDEWVRNAASGGVWDTGTPNPENGHAMHLSGYTAKGDPMPFDMSFAKKGAPAPMDFYSCETWGFDSPIALTPAGLKSAQPEVTAQFSREMFDARGIALHNGSPYADSVLAWKALGGQSLPPWDAPSGLLFKLQFSRAVAKGGRVTFNAPTVIPVCTMDCTKEG